MILLDTCALIWWFSDPDQLSPAATAAIDRALRSGTLVICAISAWEIALKVERGQLTLAGLTVNELLDAVIGLPVVDFRSLDARTCVESVRLPGSFHKDPCDRFIVAMARQLDCPIVTSDRKILDYAHVRSIW